MSSTVISLSEYGRMPWQSQTFTKEEKVVLRALAYEGIKSLAIRNYGFEEANVMKLVCGEWEGAPNISFSKEILKNKLAYAYSRTDGDLFISNDFMRAVDFARVDLKEFGALARAEIEQHTSDLTASVRRAEFHLVKK